MKLVRHVVLPGIFLAAGYYAVFGGEYSALELRSIRAQVAEGTVALGGLDRETEELAARADALVNDSRALETLARENFGMIREGEVLYRFADAAEGGDDRSGRD
jgi:cell division protein FtsB